MNLVSLGYFSKTHGIKGALILKTELNFKLSDLKLLFIELKGNDAPFFVESISSANQNYIVQLEDVKTIELAKALVSKEIMVDEKIIIKQKNSFSFVDFKIIDTKHGAVGTVKEVIKNGVQEILEIDFNGKQILLPFVKELIKKTDKKEKIIYYNAPEGLIEMYL